MAKLLLIMLLCVALFEELASSQADPPLLIDAAQPPSALDAAE